MKLDDFENHFTIWVGNSVTFNMRVPLNVDGGIRLCKSVMEEVRLQPFPTWWHRNSNDGRKSRATFDCLCVFCYSRKSEGM